MLNGTEPKHLDMSGRKWSILDPRPDKRSDAHYKNNLDHNSEHNTNTTQLSIIEILCTFNELFE